MKNLKSYKLFEMVKPHESIIDDIKDICLEFDDLGIEWSAKPTLYYSDKVHQSDCITIQLKDTQRRFFGIEDIDETLLRIRDYLIGTDWKIDCGFPSDDTYLSLEDFWDEFIGEELYDMSIFIYHHPDRPWFKK